MNQTTLRRPLDTDGRSVFALIDRCPPLDTNSAYCNLLQCSHFASTSVIAIDDDKTLGFISGYVIPDRQDTLFIWQVAVDERARGQGLAKRMLKDIVTRQECAQVTHLETTITAGNKASWTLFESFAKDFSAPLAKSEMFSKDTHFAGLHDTEFLVRIGPFSS